MGVSRRQLRGPSWRRLSPGWYAWAGRDEGPELVLAAVHRRLPRGAAFSGLIGAWLHGLDVPPSDPIEVTVPVGCGVSGRAGVCVRRANLPETEVVERRGLPVTSALRTAFDLAGRLPIVEAVVVVDMALHSKVVDLAELRSYVAGRPGSKGVVQARHVAELAEPAAESAMETRLRLLLVLAGLPRPEVQVSLCDGRGGFLGRPDLYYRAQRLGIEYDGSTHRDSVAEDDRRQNRLVNAGVRLLRFAAADLHSSPGAIVSQVRAALSTSAGQGQLPANGPVLRNESVQPPAVGRMDGRAAVQLPAVGRIDGRSAVQLPANGLIGRNGKVQAPAVGRRP